MLLKSFVTLSVLFSYVLGAPEVKIGDTTVVGRDLTESNIEFFGGIPFAEPPVGKLRFRSPVLKTRLDTDTFNATEYGKSCLQPPMFGPATGISEDCLTINIYRPAGTQPEEKLPILLWVYGGAFIIGGANTYDGSGLVSRGVARGTPIIYANFNYRLGPFGYPQGQEAHGERELNLGLKDVIAALEWLHANADAFGGDASKDFEKLVRGAILESGSASSVSAVPAAERDSVWESFVGSVPSCASVATSGKTFPCLQDATEDEILTSYLEFVGTNFMAGLSWVPTLDLGPGSLFPGVPSELYREGKFARIPFIAGTNLDEGTLFAIGFRSPNATEAELRASTLATVSPSVDPGRAARIVDRILELYPDVPALGSPYGTGDELFGFPSIYKQGDLVFDAPRRQWSEAAAEHGLKAYGYLFTQPQPGDPAAGVPHAAEISWVYGTPPDPSPSAQKFSEVMMDYWISFTVNLDPNDDNGSERPIWPQYTDQDPILLQLEGGNTTAILDDYRKEPIGFINANAPVFRK